MKTFLLVICFAAMSMAASSTAALWQPADAKPLMESYTLFLVIQQVQSQGAALCGQYAGETRAEAAEAVSGWVSGKREAIKTKLENAMGESSRAKFEAFITDITEAEKAGDPALLKTLVSSLGWFPKMPDSYETLRMHVAEVVLAADLKSGADLLAEIQTWADMRAKGQAMMPLKIWLDRSARAAETDEPALSSKPVNPLKAAEAAPASMEGWSGEEGRGGPLGAFAQSREERRQKVLEQSQAGMAQVAAEREAEEQESAAKKLAAAQAEADNMRRQAEKLAATEAEALEQRKNGWGAKIKAVVGATVTATVGGFTGAIGARAADEAVNAIFND